LCPRVRWVHLCTYVHARASVYPCVLARTHADARLLLLTCSISMLPPSPLPPPAPLARPPPAGRARPDGRAPRSPVMVFPPLLLPPLPLPSQCLLSPTPIASGCPPLPPPPPPRAPSLPPLPPLAEASGNAPKLAAKGAWSREVVLISAHACERSKRKAASSTFPFELLRCARLRMCLRECVFVCVSKRS